LCSRKLIDKLGVSGPAISKKIYGFNGLADLTGCSVDLTVQGINLPDSYMVKDVFAVAKLPDVKHHVLSNDTARHANLHDIALTTLEGNDVDIFIGADVLGQHPPTDMRPSPFPGVPGARLTPFGWVVLGMDARMNTAVNQQLVITSACSNFISDVSLCDSCHADFPDANTDPFRTEPSVDDKIALRIMESSVCKVNGRFQIEMPWIDKTVPFPDNRQAVLNRLLGMRKRFRRDPELFGKYCDKIREYVSNGYAKIITVDSFPKTDRSFYIAHFSTGVKFRVVFDLAKPFEGVSVNNQLLSGPDDVTALVGVLTRFRQEPVAFACDISQMFHRILTYPRDSDSLRFFWFENDSLDGGVVEMAMLVHPFGARSSGSIAQFCLRKTASDNVTNADPDTVSCVNRSMYVDDCLHSCPTVDKARSVISQLRTLLSESGFRLAKFVSNRPEALQGVPASDCSPLARDFDLNKEMVERVLGVTWDVARDRLQVRTRIKPKPATLRGILSMVSQAWDPLGLIQPYLLPARLLIQELSRLEMPWDKPLTGDLLKRWEKWLAALPSLDNIPIPRCYKPENFHPVDYQLHVFGDSSSIAYGACVYLRMCDADGVVVCTLVRGVSRVVPKKRPTIPKLELTAATCAVKLASEVRRDLEFPLDGVYYWTDSLSVLGYIRNTSTRFKTFVHNRPAIIHALTEVSAWRHCPTEINVADIASRGLMPDQWETATTWISGPDFLKLPEPEWPSVVVPETPVEPAVQSASLLVALVSCPDTASPIRDLLRKFSSFDKLVRSVAWMIRFRLYLRWRACGSLTPLSEAPVTGQLSVNELQQATAEIVRLVQFESFPDVMTAVSDGTAPYFPECKKLKSRCGKAIRKLSPSLRSGALVVGGRLRYARLPLVSRQPFILPADHHVTRLIVEKYHRLEGHLGTLHVLACVRKQFWILQGQSVVRRILRKCMLCQRRSAPTGEQFMADLPACRVNRSENVFSHCSVDYFGPLVTKRARTELKRYGCIFTCMATRAVHLEVVNSLESRGFLQAFFRFSDIRGRPTCMYSDNGTTMVGAQRELRAVASSLGKSVSGPLADAAIQWCYTPPLTPHCNAVSERLIKDVKRILLAMSDGKPLRDDELPSLFTGITRIMNDRPLTPLSDDPSDFECLTPNSSLLGRLDPSLPVTQFYKADEFKSGWRYVQRHLDNFWKHWVQEYLPMLQGRAKWNDRSDNLVLGDLVLMCDENLPRGKWPKALVTEVYPDDQGLVRHVKVRSAAGEYKRDVRKLCRLELG